VSGGVKNQLKSSRVLKQNGRWVTGKTEVTAAARTCQPLLKEKSDHGSKLEMKRAYRSRGKKSRISQASAVNEQVV
jgi:hypothetical protein